MELHTEKKVKKKEFTNILMSNKARFFLFLGEYFFFS